MTDRRRRHIRYARECAEGVWLGLCVALPGAGIAWAVCAWLHPVPGLIP